MVDPDCLDCDLGSHFCEKCGAEVDHEHRLCDDCKPQLRPPAEDPYDWAGYFRNYAALRKARNKEGGFRVEIDENGMEVAVEVDSDDDEEQVTILEQAVEVEVAEVPAGVKAIHKRLLAKNYEVTIMASRTAHPATVYKAKSAASAKVPHAKGDPKLPAHERQHVSLLGILWGPDGEPAMALWANWSRTIKDKAPNSFQWARMVDPINGLLYSAAVAEMNNWLDIVAPAAGKAVKKSKPAPQMNNHNDARAEIELGEWRAS